MIHLGIEIMPKYSTGSGDNDSEGEDSESGQQRIEVSVSDWLKEALNQIVHQSDLSAREAIRRPLEYAVIQWNKEFERQNNAFDIPGEHIWEPEFRCLECKSSNTSLFREVFDGDGAAEILCLNCDHRMSRDEVTRLARAAEIQDMEPYTLKKEGTRIQHEYEGDFRTPMRFECRECKELELIMPSPTKIDALICPRCGNTGEILEQVGGPVAKGFEKYPPDKYHSESGPDSVGHGISRGQYDELEKAYKSGYEQ